MTLTMTVTALLSTALLLLVSATLTTGFYTDSIHLTVFNSISNVNETYHADIPQKGILLGAMRTLQDSTDFKFVVTEDHNYGPFLVSVNGVAGSTEDHTYWELLAEFKNGTTFRSDVGVGCFIPFPQQRVILKFTKY